jgi:E3 ubiquitin-protein ligase BOI and related proteins
MKICIATTIIFFINRFQTITKFESYVSVKTTMESKRKSKIPKKVHNVEENSENKNSENINNIINNINNNNNNNINNNNSISPSVTRNYEWACKICKTNQITGIIIPCRHLCICLDCESIVLRTNCPICAGVCTGTMYFPIK